MKKYNFSQIEKKWQKIWKTRKVYEPNLVSARKPFYNLMMFPYPSAEGLHVGNMYAFTGSDIYGRFKRMQGYDVFEPMGLDGFGIHSENYAIKIGTHPMRQAKISEKRFYKQLEIVGNGFAWNEHLETYDPEYYKWTQWIFVQMWKHGLAYRKKQPVNWCPSCKTVLADEQVIDGKCERCGTMVIKKELEQWFFKITKYAERLLKNLDTIDWSEKVKIAQRNWIGRSTGAEIEFALRCSAQTNAEMTQKIAEKIRRDSASGQRDSATLMSIKVFTTRPDTLFGATYMVLAPEHDAISNFKFQISNYDEVERYVREAKKKSEEERVNPSTGSGQGKTGVELKGIKAINPANNEEMPIFVADYVLSGYGTGAIMAVPAHDERDFEFAKRFKLPIREVVVPYLENKRNPIREGTPVIERKHVDCILRNPKTDEYACLKWSNKLGWTSFIGGGIEKNEDPIVAGVREIKEESGYRNVRFVGYVGRCFGGGYAVHKSENRISDKTCLFFELESDAKDEVERTEKDNHVVVWLKKERVKDFLNVESSQYLWDLFERNGGFFVDAGILVDSGKFTRMESEEAKWEITKFVGGKRTIQYRLRDWLISRQRYWGPPIPMIHCDACAAKGKGERKEMPGWYAVPEKNLPVKLPFVKDFRPKGKDESPLASAKSFYEVRCPACKGNARRETDVSDTFLDSAWYYLGYLMTSQNWKLEIGNWKLQNLAKQWLPVNMYIGGAEHSVLHLLYVRFVALALRDMKFLNFLSKTGEPFPLFRAHGLLIKDGAKMSKSKGNVVNPDEYIRKFGADAFRTYLIFLAPFEQGGDFRDQGILGITRFLDRVWKFGEAPKGKFTSKKDASAEQLLHRTIKKVTEDIESLHYNTAVSALMILFNKFEEAGTITKDQYKAFLCLLAPFAPYLTEELWAGAGEKGSIHLARWPVYKLRLTVAETFPLVIQINGKHRGTVQAPRGVDEKRARTLALQNPLIKKAMGEAAPKKVVYVKNRIINFVL